MNKLLIFIPFISLLAIGTILLFKETPDTFASSVSFEALAYCRKSKDKYLNVCAGDQDYASTSELYSQKTIRPNTMTPECKLYREYQKNSKPTSLIDENNYYSNCFLAPEIAEIAKTSKCFNGMYYYAIVRQCAGL